MAARPVRDRMVFTDGAAGPSVKKSLAESGKAGKKVKLGPSEGFLAAAEELDQAERRFLGKKPATPVKRKSTRARK